MNLVAFTGAARSGKDEAGKALVAAGYTRRCFGDIIKGQVDQLVGQHFGFSAFTEVDAEKQLIRPLLETWGDVNYDRIMAEFFDSMPEKAVNTRLVRVREAEEWVRQGGVIFDIYRPGFEPATQWEADALDALYEANLIEGIIHNDGTVAELHAKILREVA